MSYSCNNVEGCYILEGCSVFGSFVRYLFFPDIYLTSFHFICLRFCLVVAAVG